MDYAPALRKLRNGLALQRRWLAHCAHGPRRGEALRDLGRWLWTSLPGAPGARGVPGSPWITFDALRWLDARLAPEMRVFEWGSGGSTIFFSARVREVVSVEHDPSWHALVAERLAALGRRNVELLLVPPEPVEPAAGPGARRVRFRSSDPAYAGFSFERYARAIEGYPDERFDVIVVDGRARVGCLELALAKVRPGGAIVVDNSERPDAAAALDALAAAGWAILHFAGPGPRNLWPAFWRTSIVSRGLEQQGSAGALGGR